MPVILPTDLLFFILLLAFAAYAVYAYRQPMLRRAFLSADRLLKLAYAYRQPMLRRAWRKPIVVFPGALLHIAGLPPTDISHTIADPRIRLS